MANIHVFVGVLAILAVAVLAAPQTRPTRPPRDNSTSTSSTTSSTTSRSRPSTTTRGPASRRPSSTVGPSPSIILGEPAGEGEIPFQALLFSNMNGSEFGWDCGGSLIDAHWVLTAAHCVEDTDGTMVELGSISRFDMTYSEWSYQRFMHPNYDRTGVIEDDIALIKLPRAAPTNTANIAVVPMATDSLGAVENEIVRASGFGVVDEAADQDSDVLLKVNLRTISNTECFQSYDVTDNQICTVYSTQVGQNHCEGDSGGPISYDNGGTTYLVGVASYGSDRGCDADVPSVNTRVSKYQDWIQQTMAANP